MWKLEVVTLDGVTEIIAEFRTEAEALEAMPDDTGYCAYSIVYAGKHQRNRRTVAEHDGTYAGKHTAMREIIAELSEMVADMADALGLTDEFIAEITAPAREIAQKLTARIRARVQKEFKAPEVRIRWKYSGFWDAGIYDGKGLAFLA